MSDIFISYAREDRAKAKEIAEALQEQGWTVWWDRNIPPGKTFDEVISEALNTAKCVIVLWSEASTRSDWVKEEANEGARRHILVPALIEDVEIPLGFRRIESAGLVGRTKNSETPEFNQFLQAVAELLRVDVKPKRSPPPIKPRQQGTWLRWPAGLVIFLIFGVLGWGAAVLIHDKMPPPRSGPVPLFAWGFVWLIGLVVAYRVWKRLGRKGRA